MTAGADMAPMTTRSESSASERARYLETGITVRCALDEAIRLLRLKVGADSGIGESGLKSMKRLQAARSCVDAEMIGFLYGAFGIEVPDAATESEIRALSHELFAAMSDTSAEEIIARAGELLRRWERTGSRFLGTLEAS